MCVNLTTGFPDFGQSIVVLIFFAPYIAFQVPGAIIVKKLGPRWTLPAMTMSWGFLVIVRSFPSGSARGRHPKASRPQVSDFDTY